ncbi:PhzF family phenazine biosynthesis protein [Shimazuella sp. AN120528]|uniref:PhzF family phenazine biosynthesis protein n=1 Tax=Shimazuella soli TaxID=1892854 RepID=UPI001F11645C|nr:PhzF family phenazine biosynthesis protein [Shimazuella soli]MCH5584360.1 PhzF family phenazine biosynthesis protein [Shimazuella soli]
MAKQFLVVNSFTGKHGIGNPAAIFCDSSGLNDQQMQAIAMQLNLVETVFVFPAEDADFTFRYFTPNKEVPVAGHPTVAACIALVHTNKINPANKSSIYIHTADGVREVRIEENVDSVYIKMKQVEPSFPSIASDRKEVAEILGIEEQDLLIDYPVQAVDLGLKHLIVPVKSLERLMAIKRNISPLKQLCVDLGVDEVQAFTFETYSNHATLHTRNICPREGLEDPACGIGNAALGAYLCRMQEFIGKSIIAEQGNAVDMPCDIEVEIGKQGDIWIGGTGKLMIQGEYLAIE